MDHSGEYESKLDYLKRVGAEIEAAEHQTPLAKTAIDLLDRLCDTWGYPRYREIGRYQLKFASSGGSEGLGYFLRDKETGVVVRSGGRTEESARANCLHAIRAAIREENLGLCFPKGGSLHCALCTCAANRDPEGNMRLSRWEGEEDSHEYDFEYALGYGRG
jgi:hypothetical protein